MPLTHQARQLFQGFSKLSREERFQRLLALGALTGDDIQYLNEGGIKDAGLADQFIENVIGYFQLPLGVATHFCIDGQDYVIPLAVEETSIIAALSKTAKWIRQKGTITTQTQGDTIIGQIQLAKVHNFARLKKLFLAHKENLIAKANQEVAANMVRRGGGVVDLTLRALPRDDGGTMAIIHLFMNSCDAMGANIINQVLEYLKNPIEALTHEEVSICILSNLNDQKLTKATVLISEIEAELGERLEEASLFAEMDPYRAATHNKGIMNGIDALLIATGNDWRAVEAGMHAFAARSGQYKPLSHWRYRNGILKGELIAPIIVGTVGGVTALHPTAKLCMRMLGIESANHLSRLAAAVGLVQNLGAIKALCTEGIIKGHMRLHLDNLILGCGATEPEMPVLKERLKLVLNTKNRVSLNHAYELLAELRKAQVE